MSSPENTIDRQSSKKAIERVSESIEHLKDPAEIVKHAAGEAAAKLEDIAASAAQKVAEESLHRAEEVKSLATDTAERLKELAKLVAREMATQLSQEIGLRLGQIEADFLVIRTEMAAMRSALKAIDERIDGHNKPSETLH